MKKISLVFLSFVLFISLPSCKKVVGHGPVVSETRSISNFTSIHFAVPGNLFYTQDSVYRIEIHAQDNIIREIETYLVGTELTIKVDDHVRLRSREDIRVNISAPSINGLSLSGSGNLHVTNTFRPTNARLLVSGSGSMNIHELISNNVDAAVSGSGELMVLNGQTNHEEAEISGSGKIDLLGVVSRTARTRISGSGSIKVHVTEELNSKISGSGTVYYTGTPTVNTTVSGSGKVIKL